MLAGDPHIHTGIDSTVKNSHQSVVGADRSGEAMPECGDEPDSGLGDVELLDRGVDVRSRLGVPQRRRVRHENPTL